MFLSRINKNLNDRLVASGKKPVFDEDPKGSGVPAYVPTHSGVEEVGVLTESTPEPVQAEASEAEENEQARKALATKPKKRAAPKPKKSKEREKAVKETKTPRAVPAKPAASGEASDLKMLAAPIPLEMHTRLEEYLKRPSCKGKTKRELVKIFIDQGLKRLGI